MSTRHLYALVLGLVSLASVGCCCGPIGCGCGLGGRVFNGSCASCGCPEASCCCPEPACGCCDVCTGPSCGCCDSCCDPCCGCADPCCGCADVCCGTPVGSCCPILGNCCILQRLRQAFCGCGCGNSGCCGCTGGCAGCSSEGYWSEWHNDPPRGGGGCNCHGGGTASSGGHYGVSNYTRRANLAKKTNISQELRFADQGGSTTYK